MTIEQFHQIVVGGKARRLDDEHVLAADIFLNLDEDFHVRETAHDGFGHRNFEVLGRWLRPERGWNSREQLHAPGRFGLAHGCAHPVFL